MTAEKLAQMRISTKNALQASDEVLAGMERLNNIVRAYIAALEGRLAAFEPWQPITETEPPHDFTRRVRLLFPFTGGRHDRDEFYKATATEGQPLFFRPLHETEEPK